MIAVAIVFAGCGDGATAADPPLGVDADPEAEAQPEPATESAVKLDGVAGVVAPTLDDLLVLSNVPEDMQLRDATIRHSTQRGGGTSTADYSGTRGSLFVVNATGAAAGELSTIWTDVSEDDELTVTEVTVAGQTGLMVVGESMLPDSGPYPYTMVMWQVGSDAVRSVAAYGEFSEAEVLSMAETLVPRPPDLPFKVTVDAAADGVGRVRLSSSSSFTDGSGEICLAWEHGTGSGSGCFMATATEILVQQGILVAGVALGGESEVVLRFGSEEVVIATYPTAIDGVRMFAAVSTEPGSVELA